MAMMELRNAEENKKGGANDDAGDDPEAGGDAKKLFSKKRNHGQMHGKGFGAKSFAKKRQRR